MRHQLSGPGPGRPKGSRNRLGQKFLNDALAAWEEHGVSALKIMAIEDPPRFCLMMASILPKEVDITSTAITELGDDELDRMIGEMRGRLTQASPPMKVIEAKVHEPAE